MFSTINSAKYPKMRKRGVLFTLLPCVCETPAGTYTTDLCCKWYRSFWIYSSAKVSSSLVVGSPIARSRNSDGQRLCCLRHKKDWTTISLKVETKEPLTHKSGEGNRRTSAALKVPVSPVDSSRGLEPPGLFLVLAGGSGKGLSQGGDQEPDGYSIRAPPPPPEERGEPLYGTVVRWRPPAWPPKASQIMRKETIWSAEH